MCKLWSASTSDSFSLVSSAALLYADNRAEFLQHWAAYCTQPSLISVCWWQRPRTVWSFNASLPIRTDFGSPRPLAPVNWGLMNRNLQHMCHLIDLKHIRPVTLWSDPQILLPMLDVITILPVQIFLVSQPKSRIILLSLLSGSSLDPEIPVELQIKYIIDSGYRSSILLTYYNCSN